MHMDNMLSLQSPHRQNWSFTPTRQLGKPAPLMVTPEGLRRGVPCAICPSLHQRYTCIQCSLPWPPTTIRRSCKAGRGFPRQKTDDASSRTVRMALSRSALRIESVAEFPEGGAPVRISYRLRPSRSRRPGILVDRRTARIVVVAAYAPERGRKLARKRERNERNRFT